MAISHLPVCLERQCRCVTEYYCKWLHDNPSESSCIFLRIKYFLKERKNCICIYIPECINLIIFSVSAVTKIEIIRCDKFTKRGWNQPKRWISILWKSFSPFLAFFSWKSKLFICLPSILLFRQFREQHPYWSSCVVEPAFRVLFSLTHICRHMHMYIRTHTLIRSLATWWFSCSAELFAFVSNI